MGGPQGHEAVKEESSRAEQLRQEGGEGEGTGGGGSCSDRRVQGDGSAAEGLEPGVVPCARYPMASLDLRAA
eukprot:759706-Hanusia_phi.AAC.1